MPLREAPRYIMTRVFTISRALAWLTALIALSACATVPDEQPAAHSPNLEKARAAEQGGDYASAAAAYLAAAAHGDKTQRIDHLLNAADAFYRGRLPERAKQTLLSLTNSTLQPEQLVRKQRLLASLAVAENKPRDALEALQESRPELSPTERARQMELRATAYAQAGDVLAAARERVALAPLLMDNEAQRRNEQLLWLSLIKLPQSTLEGLRPAPPDILNGWIALALIAKTSAQSGDTEQRLAEWRGLYPDHPASEEVLASFGAQPPAQLARGPARIALLLPLTGAYARPAEAVRDGFLAAHFQERQNADATAAPAIKIYDTGEAPAAAAQVYERAVADGAELVVGPLAKEGVAALAQGTTLVVPVLALNYTDDEQSPPGLYQFGLSPEQEAREVAERAWLDGHVHALAIVPSGDWGNRVMRAFQIHWQALGGRVVEAQTYAPNESDFSAPLRHMLNIDASEARARALRSALQIDLKFTPQRRKDADFIFMAGFPRQARLIPPQLKFFYAGDLPIYSTSHVYEGRVDPAKDRDLDGVLFTDIPWLLKTDGDPLRAAIEQTWPRQGGLLRLYALGADAYRLAHHVRLGRISGNDALDGATGRLTIDDRGRVLRTTMWARFSRGVPVALANQPAAVQ